MKDRDKIISGFTATSLAMAACGLETIGSKGIDVSSTPTPISSPMPDFGATQDLLNARIISQETAMAEILAEIPTEVSTATQTATPDLQATIDALNTQLTVQAEKSVVTQEATVTEVAVTESVKGEGYWATSYTNPAEKDGDVWVLHNSDGVEVRMDLSNAIGFTPDANLIDSDIEQKALGIVPEDAGDFQAYLNSERDGFPKLAGYTDGTNDYNQYKDNESGPQVPGYSWMVHTGFNVEMPGIGRIEGEKGRAVMVLIINRTDRVYRFPTNSVHVEAGFQGWGRGWLLGKTGDVQETEKRLVNHFLTRLGEGVPETGFIGQCDQGADNCNSVTVITVERMQWGNNPDGSPRDQFRLIRAETVSIVK